MTKQKDRLVTTKQIPLLSVVMTVYNGERFLRESIESVLNQTFKNFEFIVVDYGSTDNTKQVLKKFGKKIKYVKEYSGTPAVARNAGIREAKGEFIAFLDSGDVWMKNKLAQQLPVFEDPEIVLCYSNARIIKADGSPTEQLVVKRSHLKSGYVFKELTLENFISTLTVVLRRSVFDRVGVFNELEDLKEVDDYELWLRIAGLKIGKIGAIREPLAYYRRRGNEVSLASNTQALEKRLEALNIIWKNYNSQINRGYSLTLAESIITTHENWSRAKELEKPYSRPTISIVMSVYNGEKYLKLAIRSILNQTYTNFEFIIIDDGSTDKTAEIIKSFSDPRIRLIQQTNQGLVRSLNEGIRIARGHLIARMDADDISLPLRLEKEIRAINASPKIALVSTFFTYIDGSDQAATTITSLTKSTDLKRGFYHVNPIGHSSVLFRKSAFNQVGGYREEWWPVEDMDLWRRMTENWELRVIPEPLHLYRLSPGSTSSSNSATQHKLTRKIIKEQWQRPYAYKSYRSIMRDARYYKNLQSPFSLTIFNQYVHEQYLMSMELFARGFFKTGLINAFAVSRLDKKLWRRLWRPAIGSFLKRLGLRKRKT